MNQELAYNILDVLQTIQDAVEQMQRNYSAGDIERFNSLSMDIWDGLTAVHEIALQEVPEGSGIRLADACTCAMESLKNVKMLVLTRPEKVRQKLEYEFSGIIETMILQFYYWGIVNENPDKENEFKTYLESVSLNKHVDEAERTGQYKYDLTIYVTGYNHLDYTKQCVESILMQLPNHINYELILLNHGSSDGTKEFFNSIPVAKTIDIAVNGAVPGVILGAIEGKYAIAVSNDVVLGYNAIENLLRCISEHDDYGWVVPATPNVSNFQTISAQYSTYAEFLNFAQENNIYNECRHEERVRLCNPVTVFKTSNQLRMYKEQYKELLCCKDVFSFPDDKASLWMRRNGFKLILAKDAYCHHFGSVTLGKSDARDVERAKFYLEGRKSFFNRFKVDPWGTGFCYDMHLINELSYNVKGKVNILGINCGLGSNPLKIRETYKEKGKKKEDTYICNFVQEKRFMEDLKAVSDEVCCFSVPEDILLRISNRYFNYIIIEDTIMNCEDMADFVNRLRRKISFDVICCKINVLGNNIEKTDGIYGMRRVGEWGIIFG